MNWIKTPNHYFNLDSISIIDVDLVGMSLELHGHGLAYSKSLDGEDAIALIQAIEAGDFIDESDPFSSWGELDDDDDDVDDELGVMSSNSGIPL